MAQPGGLTLGFAPHLVIIYKAPKKLIQSNPLKWIGLGHDYEYPLG